MKRFQRAALCLFLAAGVLCDPAFGGDLYVARDGHDIGSCGDPLFPCKSIQYTIDHVSDRSRDVIKVAQGTYEENMRVYFRSGVDQYTISGGWSDDFSWRESDPSLTVIDGGENETVIVIDSAYAGRKVTIEGFTIQHGAYGEQTGGGVDIQTSLTNLSVTLKNNLIAANNGRRGGGVFAGAHDGGSLELVLTGNRMVANSAEMGGGIGIAVASGGTITARLMNNIIARNHGDLYAGSDGVFLTAKESSASLEMVNNTLFEDGLCLQVQSPLAPLTASVTNTIIGGTLGIYFNDESEILAEASYSMIHRIQTFGGSASVVKTENMIDFPATDSLFVNPSGGDYHLRDGSPAVGQGICGDTILALNPANDRYERIAPYEDLDGDLRPPDWVETGCDIGADEVIPMIAVPDQQRMYDYDQAAVPALMDRPGDCEPFASGDLADGTLDLRVVLPRFAESVDIYLGLFLGPIDSENIYMVQPDDSLHAFEGDLVPWRANSLGGIDHRLYGEIPLSILPAGTYNGYVFVTPAGSLSAHYLWATYFEVP